MRLSEDMWPTRDAKRASWISVGLTLACLWFFLWQARGANLTLAFFIYALVPVSLGCLAVAALNCRRWHNFWESVTACLLAVVDACLILWIIASFVLLAMSLRGNAPLLFIVGLPWFTLLGIVYCLVPAVICLAIACASGALLYGLLSLMRRAGKDDLNREDLKPRPLRVVA